MHYKTYLFYMVANTMGLQELCQKCGQRQDCGKVYEQLGKSDRASVVREVVLAFLLPLAIFIISLAIFERMFSGLTHAGQLQSALSFVSALLLTLISIVLTKFEKGRHRREGG